MDSPAFGSSNRNKNLFKATANYQNKEVPSENIKLAYQVIAALAIKKNLNKLFSSLNQVMLNKKRDSFARIHSPARSGLVAFSELSQSQVEVILEVQKRMNFIYNSLKLHMEKNKIKAWREMKNFTNLKVSSDSHKSNPLNIEQKDGKIIGNKGQKRLDNWKQNSANNLPDLTVENKRLKTEIQKQQMYEESFITKMKSLLEIHEKQASKLNIKKKK